MSEVRIKEWILVPAIITLAMTLLRLTGELLDWHPVLFSREAGGALAPVGIWWLAIVFGVYFAWKLCKQGLGPQSAGKAILIAVVCLAITIGIAVLIGILTTPGSIWAGLLLIIGTLITVPMTIRTWPQLGRILLAYGFAARIPVAIVMAFAIFGDWGTHYDASPPEFPDASAFAKWVQIGVIPQFTAWIIYTSVFGTLFGGITALFVKK